MKLSNVNTTDIADGIRLGCRTMSSVFNADDDDIPFFGSVVRPIAGLSFNDSHSEAHVPGRHLNALLSAEEVLDLKIPDEVVDKHARAAFFSYGGSVPLPLNRDVVGGHPNRFLPHNIREGMHALYALVRYRRSDRARELAEASIEAIGRYWDPKRGWDCDTLEGELGLTVIEMNGPFISGIARAIGPLVKYYRATEYRPALDLAVLLKEKAIAEYFTPDGEFDSKRFGTHTHSVTCVMSSLAQLAELTGDDPLMERIQVFYDHGLRDISDALGWSIENCGPNTNPDRGEANNTGDILETALILGAWGSARHYHDAERSLRGHLLPSQLRDISFIEDPPNLDGDDGKRDVARRHFGAFGFPAPYGHAPIGATEISFNMDIVGGVVASLCEAYRYVSRSDQTSHRVNLLFDHETDAIRVESPYTHDGLRIRVKRAAPLFVRIPPWVDSEDLVVQGNDGCSQTKQGYLVISEPRVDHDLTIMMELREQEITLEHRTRSIRTRLRGDQVVAMENFGADLTFFDAIQS